MTLRRISESNPWRSLNYSLANDADGDDGYDSEYSDGAPGGIWEHNYNPSTSLWPVNPYQQEHPPQSTFDRHKVSNLRTTCAPTPPSRPSPPVSHYSHHPSDPSDFHGRRYTTPPLSPDDKSSRHSSPVTRSPVPTGPPPSISHVSHNNSPPPQQQLSDDRDHYYSTSRRAEFKRRERYNGHQTEMAASPPPRHEDRALRGRDGNIETPHITAAKPPPSDRYPYAQDYSHPRAVQDPPPFRVIRRPEQPQPRKPPSLLHSITLPPLSEFDRAPSFNGPPSSQGSFSYGSTIPSREARSRMNELPPPMLSKTIQDLFRPMSRDLPRVMHMPFALRKPDVHDIQDNSRELPSPSSNIHDHSYTSRASSNDDAPVASSSRLIQDSYTPNLNEDRSNAQKPLSSRTISESSSIAEIPQTHEETDEVQELPPPSNAVLGRLRTRGGREVRPLIRLPSPSSDSECTSVPFEPDEDDDDSSDDYDDSDTDDGRATRRTTTTRQLHRKSAASKAPVVDPSMSAPMMQVESENANDVSRGGQETGGAPSSSRRSRAGETLKDNTLPILPPADGRRPKSHQTPWNTQGAPTFKVARQATTVPPALPTGTAKDTGLTWDFSTPDPNKKTRIPYSRNSSSTQKKKAALRKAQNLERASSSQRGSVVDEEEIDELADDNDGEHQKNDAKPKPKKGSFKCPQCTILFTRNFDMSRHIKTVHETAPDEVLRSRTCPCCFTVPSRRDAFRRHLLRVPMSCNRLAQICGKPQPNIQGSQLETLYEMCRQMELRVPDVVRKHLGLQDTD